MFLNIPHNPFPVFQLGQTIHKLISATLGDPDLEIFALHTPALVFHNFTLRDHDRPAGTSRASHALAQARAVPTPNGLKRRTFRCPERQNQRVLHTVPFALVVVTKDGHEGYDTYLSHVRPNPVRLRVFDYSLAHRHFSIANLMTVLTHASANGKMNNNGYENGNGAGVSIARPQIVPTLFLVETWAVESTMEVLNEELVDLLASSNGLASGSYKTFVLRVTSAAQINARTIGILEKMTHFGLGLALDNSVADAQRREVSFAPLYDSSHQCVFAACAAEAEKTHIDPALVVDCRTVRQRIFASASSPLVSSATVPQDYDGHERVEVADPVVREEASVLQMRAAAGRLRNVVDQKVFQVIEEAYCVCVCRVCGMGQYRLRMRGLHSAAVVVLIRRSSSSSPGRLAPERLEGRECCHLASQSRHLRSSSASTCVWALSLRTAQMGP
ncbi:hypothetical protein C8F01DRAFT_1261486 [Mycena amicta]|nr:hypothetical protein C8F01DRAFT_1261486 [Mycena amicta]